VSQFKYLGTTVTKRNLIQEEIKRRKGREGKPEGKRLLGRPRWKWVDNSRMDLGEVGWGDMDWIDLAEDRNRWRAVV
jgi:hypothetical protein